MENLINIIEKLKISSKTKVSTEIETMDDFCRKYNCEFHKDQKVGDTEFNYLKNNDNKLESQIEHLLNLSSQKFKELKEEIFKDIEPINEDNYPLNIRRNQDARLIVIDCNDFRARTLCSITLGLGKVNISESLNIKNEPKNSEKIVLKIIDYLLSK